MREVLVAAAAAAAATVAWMRMRPRPHPQVRRRGLPRRFGLIGGLSPASTVDYYQLINKGVRARLGGWHSAELLVWSCDMHPVVEAEFSGDWARVGAHLAAAGRALERAGCEGLVIACNSVHEEAAFAQLCRAVSIPILHIAEVTADALLRSGVRRWVGLCVCGGGRVRVWHQSPEGIGVRGVVLASAARRDSVHSAHRHAHPMWPGSRFSAPSSLPPRALFSSIAWCLVASTLFCEHPPVCVRACECLQLAACAVVSRSCPPSHRPSFFLSCPADLPLHLEINQGRGRRSSGARHAHLPGAYSGQVHPCSTAVARVPHRAPGRCPGLPRCRAGLHRAWSAAQLWEHR